MARAATRRPSTSPALGTVGVELDGTRATAVSVTSGVSEMIRTVVSSSPSQALIEVLASFRSTDPVRVAIASPATLAAAIDVTHTMASRKAFTRQALQLLRAPAGYAVSGVLTDADAVATGRVSTGLACALPIEQVSDTYLALERMGRTGEVTSVAATVGSLEGLSLAVRARSVDVSVVSSGQPMGHVVLNLPGLETLIVGLGGSSARDRVMSALAGDLSDPLAAAEVARWVDAIAQSACAAIASWRAAGIPAGVDVLTYGPVGASPVLAQGLRQAGLNPATPALNQVIVGSSSSARLEALPAYLAAITTGKDMPAAAFVSATAVRAARRHAARRRSRAAVTMGAAMTVAVAIPTLAPMAVASAFEHYTSWNLSRSVAAVSGQMSGQAAVDTAILGQLATQLAGTSTSLPGVLNDALAAQNASISVAGAHFAPADMPEMTLALRSSGKDPVTLNAWIAAFVASHPAYRVALSGFDQHTGDLQVLLTITGPVTP